VQLARLHLAHQLPILSQAEVARANAEKGLNVMVCFEGWEEILLDREEFRAVREKQRTAFQMALSGYHLKEFLANPLGEDALEELIDAGALMRRNYSDYVRGGNGCAVSIPQARLVGLTKEEADLHPGRHLAGLFVHAQPRFHFSHSEQELLQRALSGETAEDLAMSLCISLWTVKKRWHAIYERVGAADAELLPPISDGADPHERGAERRRRLLSYLRQHPEELRPFRSRAGSGYLRSFILLNLLANADIWSLLQSSLPT
jgi:DNA-binding CsgD family transcriptional regulator